MNSLKFFVGKYLLRSPLLRQVFYMVACILDAGAGGFHYGISSLMINDKSSMKIEVGDGSLIASAAAMTVFPSGIIASFTVDKYGRKVAFLAILFPGILSFITMYFSRNLIEAFVGRLFGGVSMGALLFLSGTIVAEYTSPKLRPVLIMVKLAALNTGILLSHILGSVLHWRYICLIGVCIYVLAFIITCTWPESPSWLAKKNKFEQCSETFHWLRGYEKESQNELDEMITKWKQHKEKKTTFKEKTANFLKNFITKSFLKPTLIMVCIYIIRETIGKHVIPVYAFQIVESVTGDKENVFLYMLAIDSANVLSNLLASSIGNRINRRTLLLGGGCVANVLLLSMCLCLYLSKIGILSANLSLLPLAFLILYIIVTQTCITTVTCTLIGEIYPLEHKAAGLLTNSAISSVSILTSLYTTPKLIASFDVAGTFVIFSVIMIAVLLLMYKILPETNNKSLQEIEKNFY